MTLAVVFPGQGSQTRGMGTELFVAFPEYVKVADQILGYSLQELCANDPHGRLQDTRYTQPALFVVNALAYFSKRSNPVWKPEVLAGHSLGEYNALLAAGVIDFATGVRLVRRRGELMGQAPAGGMAAIVGLEPSQIGAVLKQNGLAAIDVANFNSWNQTVVAGPVSDIQRAEPFFTQAGARYVILKVGAAFHSRYMAEAQEAFRVLLSQIEIRLPDIPVIANYSARPYPNDPVGIRETLALQIANPVRWYELVSYLLTLPHSEIQEVGHGRVLTNLTVQISKKPLPIAPSPAKVLSEVVSLESPQSLPMQESSDRLSQRRGVLFMYTGQGSQYYGMGEALYRESGVFRDAFELCGRCAQPSLGRALSDIVYGGNGNRGSFDQFLHSNVANFALGFALSQILFDRGLCPDAVIGYGAGEFLAATIAGCLSLHDGLEATMAQARIMQERCEPGAMLAVFNSPEVLKGSSYSFGEYSIAGYNFSRHFIVSGQVAVVEKIEAELTGKGIVCQRLPVPLGLHSPAIDAVQSDLERTFSRIVFSAPRIRLYSPTELRWMPNLEGAYFWNACRNPVRFDQAIEDLRSCGVAKYVDLGPSGTLAGFVRYQLDDSEKALTAINRFGKNTTTMAAVVERLANGFRP